MGVYLSQIEPGGEIRPHVHAYEESFYIIEGEVLCEIDGRNHLLRPGDYGVVNVGAGHSWHNIGHQPVRWLEMASPQPKPPGAERDTFWVRDGVTPGSGPPPDLADPANKHLGHYGIDDIPPWPEGRIESGGLKGVLFQMMVDDSGGADHHRMFFIEYQPTVGIGLHDHCFEEAYVILNGRVEAIADGTAYELGPGDVIWTGVGSMHAFTNKYDEPVLWLETQAPLPPPADVFRFVAEWGAKGQEIEGGA
jgi:quercetin dioxygenase-like cupin family protein